MEKLKPLAPLSTAAEKLLAEDANPARISVGNGEVPVEATPDCSIRAALDLQGCDCNRDITLSHCQMGDPLSLVNATLRGCTFPRVISKD